MGVVSSVAVPCHPGPRTDRHSVPCGRNESTLARRPSAALILGVSIHPYTVFGLKPDCFHLLYSKGRF